MNKSITLALKGSAIILMFIHHLFGCGTFLTACPYGGVLSPLFSFVGGAGKICIALFLFVSGYGLFKSYIIKPNRRYDLLKRILKFLISYYTIMFLVAIPYLIYANKFEVKYLFVNLFALIHNDDILYLSFSWYVKLYLSILLILPIIKRIQNRIKCIYVDFVTHIAMPIVFNRLLMLLNTVVVDNKIISFIVNWLILVTTYYPLFGLGLLCAKYNIFEHIKGKLHCMPKFFITILSVLILCGIMIARYSYSNMIIDILYVFIFVMAFGLLIENIGIDSVLSKLLIFLGKYSFQYWLLSGMFFLNTVELQYILFFPYYSSLIVIWAFVILLFPAVCFNKLDNKIYNLLFEKHIK